MSKGKKALRVGDRNNGKGVLIKGSDNILINKRKAGRLGDLDNSHPGHGKKKKHPPNPVITGSNTVLFNKKKAARLTDKERLGHVYIQGSDNVLIGG
jgi:uncharacterized Zn-binding protein involved in type VI secretion